MSAENTLKQTLESCFSDWEGDFDVDIEQEDMYEGRTYFSVLINHSHYGPEYGFTARVDGDGSCEMDYDDDCWMSITTGNLFAFMWFESVELRKS